MMTICKPSGGTTLSSPPYARESEGGLRIAMSSVCLWGTELPGIIRFACDAGFSALELWIEQLEFGPNPAELRRLAEEQGLSLYSHAVSWDINLCSHNLAMRNASIGEVKRSIELARKLGAENITVHPGRAGAPVFGEDLYAERMEQSLAEICRFGLDAGVKVSLELMEKIPREFVTTPAIMNKLLNIVPNNACGITLDAAHLESAEMFIGYFNAMPRVDKIHLSNRRGNKFHVPVFQGDINAVQVLEFLQDKNLPIVIEGNALDREELICTLERIQALVRQKAAS
jgi:sugar phosphate isomerase/epimerase